MPFWARVQGRELGEQPVVALHATPDRGGGRPPPAPASGALGSTCAQGQSGQQGAAAEIGVHRFGHLLDGPVEDVGEDRAPQGRGGAAPDGPDRPEPADR